MPPITYKFQYEGYFKIFAIRFAGNFAQFALSLSALTGENFSKSVPVNEREIFFKEYLYFIKFSICKYSNKYIEEIERFENNLPLEDKLTLEMMKNGVI